MSTKKEPAETAAPKKAAKPEPVAYMGPTLRGIATQYRVYTDGAPEALTEKAKALPCPGGIDRAGEQDGRDPRQLEEARHP